MVKIEERSYLKIDTGKDIFKNIKDRRELQRLAFDFIKNGNENFEIRDILNDNKTIRFIRKGAKEFVYGKNSQINKKYLIHKLRLAPSIDDLIDNASIIYKAPLKHKSSLFNNGYDNFQGIILIDNILFRYIVRIGIASKSDSIFYDVSINYLDTIEK